MRVRDGPWAGVSGDLWTRVGSGLRIWDSGRLRMPGRRVRRMPVSGRLRMPGRRVRRMPDSGGLRMPGRRAWRMPVSGGLWARVSGGLLMWGGSRTWM
ncbi:hypothetical protein ABZ897_48850 [Nonomuraea sp. NPDC046802]|uniref:hypothetical protein n=1 Tax=Nonomuraea sp. NPDC046802 TaxID=3154919 RepID=UPI0034010730